MFYWWNDGTQMHISVFIVSQNIMNEPLDISFQHGVKLIKRALVSGIKVISPGMLGNFTVNIALINPLADRSTFFSFFSGFPCIKSASEYPSEGVARAQYSVVCLARPDPGPA